MSKITEGPWSIGGTYSIYAPPKNGSNVARKICDLEELEEAEANARVPGSEPIVVRLVEVVNPYKVRLGIVAADDVEVHRAEIDAKIHGPIGGVQQ